MVFDVKNLWLPLSMPELEIGEELEEPRPGTGDSSDTNIAQNSDFPEIPSDVQTTPNITPHVLSQMIYFKYLLSVDDDDTKEKYDSLTKEWQAAAATCAHLRAVFDFWKSLTAQITELGIIMSIGHVQCYCEKCNPTAFPHQSGELLKY